MNIFFTSLSPSLNLQSVDMSLKTLWPFFHCGKLQNSVNHKAYHLIQANLTEQLEDLDPAAAILAENAQFAAGELLFRHLCINLIVPSSSAGSIRGKKSVFIAHLLSHGTGPPCTHASADAITNQ
jgi:hypothetical protein